MEDELKGINKNLKKINRKLEELHVVTVRQQVILDEHVKRSNMLEAKMAPVERHVAMVSGAIKFIGFLGVIAAIIEAYVMATKGH